MDTITRMKKSLSQEERNKTLISALKSENPILIELALELEPDFLAGGEMLLYYAISNSKPWVVQRLMKVPEITENKEIMNKAVRLAVSAEHLLCFSIMEILLKNGGDKDVALAAVLEYKAYPLDISIELIKKGATAFFAPMHLERHQYVAEALFKLGYGKSIQFSTQGLEDFCTNICKSSRVGAVKALIRNRPDLVEKLTQIAVIGGYTATLKVLHQENAITSISSELLDKAIRKKRYYTIKYIVENGLHELELSDIVSAAMFGSEKTLLLFVENAPKITDEQYSKVINIAKQLGRDASAETLMKVLYTCDTDL